MPILQNMRMFGAVLAGIGAVFATPAITAPRAIPTDLAANPPAGCTGPTSPYWLNVHAENMRSGKGLLAITLYSDDSSRFLMKGGSLYVGRTAAIMGKTSSCIFVPKPGVYVLALYHDENGNQKFDRTGFGLPAEGYGFSNNPSTLLGLPSFRSVRLNVDRSGLTSHIKMKYP